MQYTRLGTSGLTISRIALGTMGFGDGSREKWALGYDDAAPFFQQALDLGITFWDTANIYSFGASETIVGRAWPKRAVTTSCSPPRCIRQSVKALAGPGCPARRSWSRSTSR